MDWKVVAASVTGISHIARGIPCQDAFYWLNQGGVFIAIVSDGAGTAAESEFGAQHGSKTICEEVLIQFAGSEEQPDREELEFWIRTAIKTARNTLPGVISDEDRVRYHATIVGVVITDETGLFFHIGDGLAIAMTGAGIDDQRQDAMVSKPENGSSELMTYFYTEPQWFKHIRFTELSPEMEAIALMSDGAMAIAVDQKTFKIGPDFILSVDKCLRETDLETSSSELKTKLNRPATHAITTDDKTFLWARRAIEE